MLCSISGELPQNPVISSKSGHVFEKHLIEKYLSDNDGKCPMTNQPLAEEDLISVKQAGGPVAPRPPTLTSIPSLLSVFQNEWDSVMLEVFTLKQQYQQLRQQLSHALYQNDSSARVIARLLEERDEARQALADLKSHIGSSIAPAASGVSEAMEEDVQEPAGMSSSVLELLEKTSRELSKGRKKRSLPEGLANAETISNFGQTKTISSLHSAEPIGISALALNGEFVCTGGNDGNLTIYNLEENTVVIRFDATTPIGDLAWDSESSRIFSTGSDNVVRCWAPEGGSDFSSWTLAGQFSHHNNSVTGFAINPCRQFGASTSLDGTWRFYDVYAGQLLATMSNPESQGYTCGKFHPDGALFGAGTTDATVQIWSIKDQAKAAEFTGHTGELTSISFSENGYFLATTSQSDEVKLWDLRKLVNFETIKLSEPTTKVTFDPSGAYLAAGCQSSVDIFKVKSWREPLVSLATHATDMLFTENCKSFITVSNAQSDMRVFGATS